MDADDISSLGDYCETVLVTEQFNTIIKAYERQIVEQALNTKPEHAELRERIYASLNGVRDFLGFMQEFVIQRDKLNKPEQADAQDDPAVHDIYAEI